MAIINVIISPRQSLSWLLKGVCVMCPEDLYDSITEAVDVICTALQQYKLVVF